MKKLILTLVLLGIIPAYAARDWDKATSKECTIPADFEVINIYAFQADLHIIAKNKKTGEFTLFACGSNGKPFYKTTVKIEK